VTKTQVEVITSGAAPLPGEHGDPRARIRRFESSSSPLSTTLAGLPTKTKQSVKSLPFTLRVSLSDHRCCFLFAIGLAARVK
jgi:hypothetical protein